LTDWNWFFSSVSQSIAAVVGIMAGFITTRLINNQAEFSRRSAKTKELLAECFRLVDEAQRRRFVWYNRWENEAAYRRAENSLGFNIEQNTIDLYQKTVFSPFHPIDDVLVRLQLMIEAQKRNEHVGPRYSDEMLTNQRAELDAERERINELLTTCKHQARAVAQHLAEMDSQPESSPVVTFAIIATLLLFFTGVVYPLSFLPMPSDVAPELSFAAFFEILLSLRGAILTVCASILRWLVSQHSALI
jgi:uncharacterized membrane-anchored protein YhcB (DUF1043 family)